MGDASGEKEVRQSLSRFDEDLWIKRRLELGVIFEHLNTLNPNLKEQVDSWIRFFKFLATECSGNNFQSDKQWSDLMNLMQISKRSNHRSVTMREIMKNKSFIESNAKNIRLLNESAKLGQTIESLLSDLDSLIPSNHLDLPLKQNNCLMLNELFAAKTFIKDHCQPIIYTLKLELENELILKDPRLDVWRQRVDHYESQVRRMCSFLDLMYKLQTKLTLLKPLMSIDGDSSKSTAQHISDSLSSCKRKFKTVRDFHDEVIESLYMLAKDRRTKKTPSKLALIKIFNHKNELMNDMYDEGLKQAFDDLKMCHDELDRIMLTLRIEFGRFYFVNDLELLTIIALDTRLVTENSSAENQQLICKLFNNSISSFITRDNYLVGVRSPFGEILTLEEEPVAIKKKVNLYSVEIVRILNETIRKLKRTLRAMLMQSINGVQEADDIDWSLPVQLMNLAEYIKFCRRVEGIFMNEGKLEDLIEYYELRLSQLSNKSRSGRTRLKEFKISAVISLAVHFISTLTMLQSSQVQKVDDWNWIKQPRYYITSDQNLQVKIADAQLLYKFDYLSLESSDLSMSPENDVSRHPPAFKRLINTKITERCLLVASQTICHYKLGANPYGPAGSGKTETVKALGHLVGCQVIVHNCDETNDTQSLDKLIWGLAHTGLWGCFDEVNRLSKSVLSTFSATLELVQTSIRENRNTVKLDDGSLMYLDKDSTFFVTLNPGDSRYKGRRRLPANLRSLFLPISMIRVEIDSIVGENLLTLGGELHWDISAKKAFRLGESLRDWLQHIRSSLGDSNRCEWDLRLVIAILRRLKMLACNYVGRLGHTKMDHLLVKSIELEVKQRLDDDQLSVFQSSIQESFPKKHEEKLDDWPQDTIQILNNKINKIVFNSPDICITSNSIRQASYLSSQLETWTGVMLLGPSGSGKSTTWRLLQASLADTVKVFVLNPKAQDKRQLYGYVEPTSQKWVDGVFTTRVRESIDILQRNPALRQVWIVLDGPAEPDWVESLNSVLDDNQVLTLGSGERLHFSLPSSQLIKLIFETSDIKYLSPATMSRIGLVYHSALTVERNLDENVIKDISKDQLIAANNASSLLESPCEFMMSQQSKLLIIAGLSNNLAKFKVDKNLFNDSSSEYRCSEFSTSSHLLELISATKSGSQIMIINAHIIQHEDQWEGTSFIELIRFIATYDGYYDLSHTFIPFKVKFILVLDSLDRLNTRILSLSHVVTLKPEDVESEPDLHFEGTLAHFLSTCLPSVSCTILTLSCNLFGSGRRNLVLKYFEGWEINTFSNSIKARQSIEVLEDLSQASSTLRGGPKRLFLMSDLELILLSKELKSLLLHRLNWIKLQPMSTIRFIYLAHEVEQNSNQIIFWSSMGKVYHFNDETSTRSHLIDEVRTKLYTNLASDIGPPQLNWLTSKLSELISKESIDLHNQRKFNSFLHILISLINTTKTDLTNQGKAFRDGLRRLSEFEETVDRIKAQCKTKEDDLIVKSRNIEKLMGEINVAIEESQQQKAKINELKAKQSIKTAEIKHKSDNVEHELAKVLPLIEFSKVEVEQCLKPEALNELKTLRSPTKTVKDILDVLFVLLGLDDSSWSAIKAHLTKYSLKDELTSYDFQKRLNKPLLDKVEWLIETKQDSFSPTQAARASKAIVPILGWIQATLEYGKVLVMMAPLKEEMDNLRKESEEIESSARDIENQLAEIDLTISQDSWKLANFRREFSESERVSSDIRTQLNKAEMVRTQVADQIIRWRLRLGAIEFLLEGSELVSLCLLASSLASYYEDSIQLRNWFVLFNLDDSMSNDQMVTKLVSLFILQGEGSESFLDNAQQTERLLQLLILKFSMQSMIPFIDLGFRERLSKEELTHYLCFKGILCTKKDVTIITSDEFTDWAQLVELSMKLKKLVVIFMHDPMLDLDIIHLALEKFNPGSTRILFVGQLNKHNEIRHLVRPIKLLTRRSSEREVSETIMNSLVKFHDSNLMNSLNELESDLELKRNGAKLIEKSLLEQLRTNMNSSAHQGDEFHDDLTKILSDSYESSRSLTQDVIRLERKMSELEVRRAKYQILSEGAAAFYQKFLTPLDEQDTFYHVSLDRYLELLVRSVSRNQESSFTGEQIVGSIDYGYICERVLHSMRPDHKENFRDKLRQNQQVTLPGNESQLRETISELIQEILGAQSGSCKLMVVLHESMKSSPQIEVDELLKQRSIELGCNYSKLYATSDTDGRLESAIEKILSIDRDSLVTATTITSSPITTTTNHATSSTATLTRFLCIVNAHLSSRWINKRLVRLMKSASTTEAKLLVVLVAESSEDANEQLDSSVLDFAQVKYWHDELSLNLTNRFDLFVKQANLFNSLSDEKSNLARQLILFHVVCQERSTKASPSDRLAKPIGWSKSYSFEYDLLSLALKTLRRLYDESVNKYGTNTDQFRVLLCRYLEDIIYGPRMETLEDELALGQLIRRNFSLAESAEQDAFKLKQLRSTITAGKLSEYNALFMDLIGLTGLQ